MGDPGSLLISTSKFSLKKIFIFVYLALSSLSCGTWGLLSSLQPVRSLVVACDLVLWPGIESRPLNWQHRVLATSPSGKSPRSLIQTRRQSHFCHVKSYIRRFWCPDLGIFGGGVAAGAGGQVIVLSGTNPLIIKFPPLTCPVSNPSCDFSAPLTFSVQELELTRYLREPPWVYMKVTLVQLAQAFPDRRVWAFTSSLPCVGWKPLVAQTASGWGLFPGAASAPWNSSAASSLRRLL